MDELETKLEEFRCEDIEFFAKRYAELFGKHFDKNTLEEIKEFKNEIIEDLNKKVLKYVVDNISMEDLVAGEYSRGLVTLVNFSYEDKSVRIHELVHAYNYKDESVYGLRDFRKNIVLRSLDEGTTELIAQLIMGNKELDNIIGYNDEVELANYLIGLVGEKIVIQSTRCNPELLCQEVDKLLGTKDLLKKMESLNMRKSLTKPYIGKPNISYLSEEQMRSQVLYSILNALEHESIVFDSDLLMLYDAVNKTNNPELIDRFNKVNKELDAKKSYVESLEFSLTLRSSHKFRMGETSLATVMQEQLKEEIQQISFADNPKAIDKLKIEMLKFLYDEIDYVNYKANFQNSTLDYTEYCKNFRSSIDGSNERLGIRFGTDSIGETLFNKCIFETGTSIARSITNRDYLPEIDIGFEEHLNNYEFDHLGFVAEKLLIKAQLCMTNLSNWRFIWEHFIDKNYSYSDISNVLPKQIGEYFCELSSRDQNLIKKYIEKSEAVRMQADLEIRIEDGIKYNGR